MLKNTWYHFQNKFLFRKTTISGQELRLSDGATTPSDILAIKGPTAVQEYILNEVQDVYRMQGVKINDKHYEVIIRQMMRKVEIEDPGDTRFLEKQVVDKNEFSLKTTGFTIKKLLLNREMPKD
jgi:DNA-directed RNA polymerase subunit beta'